MFPRVTEKTWRKLIKEHQDIFPEELPKGVPPEREVHHKIEIDPGSKRPYRPPYRLGLPEQDELEEQIKDLLAQGFICPSCSLYGAPASFRAQERWQMADVC